MQRTIFTSFLLLFAVVSNGQFLRKLNLEARDIAYSSLTDRVYVAIYKPDQHNLCIIDPLTGQTDTCYSFPGYSFCVAVSENQKYLYAGYGQPNGAGRIVQIDLSTGQTVLNKTLQTNTFPSRIWPIPGLPNSIVARISYFSPTSNPDYTAVFDSGIQRPSVLYAPNEVAFTNNASKLIGINNFEWNNALFIKMDITPNGIVQGDLWQTAFYKTGMQLFHFGNYLVTSIGTIYNISNGDPVYESFYFNEPFKAGGPAVFDKDSTVVYFALNHQKDAYATTINTYSLNGQLLEKFGHPDIPESPVKMIDCGGGGRLALISNTFNQLVLITPCKSSDPAPAIEAAAFAACYGDTIELVATPGYAAYSWSTGDNSPTLQTTDTYPYWVSAIGSDGCLTEKSDIISVYFDSKPPQPYYDPGGTKIELCEGDSVVIKAFVFNGPGNNSYLWSTGETTSQITASTAGDYLLSLLSEHGGCKTDAPYPLTVEIVPLPDKPLIRIWGDTAMVSNPIRLCAGDTLYLEGYQKNGSGADLYQWNTGESTYVIAVTSQGEYSLRVINQKGCFSESQFPAVVEVIPSPDKPEIKLIDDSTLGTTAVNVAYQWLRNGIPLPFANGPTLVLDSAGIYSLIVSNAEGCHSDVSVPYYYNQFPLYPNPATTEIKLWNGDFGQIKSYKILNSNGVAVMDGKPEQTFISIAGLNNGFYYVFWFNGEGKRIGISSFVKGN